MDLWLGVILVFWSLLGLGAVFLGGIIHKEGCSSDLFGAVMGLAASVVYTGILLIIVNAYVKAVIEDTQKNTATAVAAGKEKPQAERPPVKTTIWTCTQTEKE